MPPVPRLYTDLLAGLYAQIPGLHTRPFAQLAEWRLWGVQISVVYKFGGSSVATAERMREVAAIVCAFPDQAPLVVLSAMGKVCVRRVCFLFPPCTGNYSVPGSLALCVSATLTGCMPVADCSRTRVCSGERRYQPALSFGGP